MMILCHHMQNLRHFHLYYTEHAANGQDWLKHVGGILTGRWIILPVCMVGVNSYKCNTFTSFHTICYKASKAAISWCHKTGIHHILQKVKVNVTLEQSMTAQRGTEVRSTLYLTLELDWGGGWPRPHPGCCTTENGLVPTV